MTHSVPSELGLGLHCLHLFPKQTCSLINVELILPCWQADGLLHKICMTSLTLFIYLFIHFGCVIFFTDVVERRYLFVTGILCLSKMALLIDITLHVSDGLQQHHAFHVAYFFHLGAPSS